jgi:hypothetical protein
MKRLEDIPKKQSFKVPDGYFEDLPMRILASIEAEKPKSVVSFSYGKLALLYTLPIILIGIVSVVVWNNYAAKTEDPLVALENVAAEQLVAYLENDEISADDILENASFSNTMVDEMQQPYEGISDKELDELANEYNINI